MTNGQESVGATGIAARVSLRKRISGALWKDEYFALLPLALVLVAIALAYAALISARGQYPLYQDEEFIAKPAWRMVQEGSLKPGFYRYGSWPLYLAAIAMRFSAGLLLHRGMIQSLADVTSVGFPYYSHIGVMAWPRILYAMFGVLGLAACGGMARAYGRRALWWLGPVALCASSWYLKQAWSYLNVDIVVTGTATLGLAYLAWTHQHHSSLHRAWIPGVICGAVCATKYNNVVLLMPFVLALADRRDIRRTTRQLAHLLIITGVVFVVLEPFSILDRAKFVADVQFELAHYRGGHVGHDAEAGLSQLQFYLGEVYRDFGLVLCALAVGGVVRGIITNRRLAILLLAYPAALLALMCSYRVHFTRAALPIFPVVAAHAALGFMSLLDILSAPWAARLRAHVQVVAGIGLGAVVVLFSPLERVPSRMRPVVDSRIAAARWLESHVSPACAIIAPEKLGMDLTQSKCELRSIKQVDRELAPLVAELQRDSPSRPLLLLFSEWSHLAHRRGGDAVAERWNHALEAFGTRTTLFRAGTTKVWVNYPTVEEGNPILMIYRLE